MENNQNNMSTQSSGGNDKNRSVMIIIIVVIVVVAGGWFLNDRWQRRQAVNLVEDLIEAQTGAKATVDVSTKGDLVTVTGNDTELTVGTAATLPEDFPTDVPIYTGATLTSTFSSVGIAGHSVAMETADATTAVLAFYKDQMAANGWTQQSAFDVGGAVQRTYAKDGSTVALTLSRDATRDMTVVSLSVIEL